MDKHTKIRIQTWCKKFCQIISNINWKKNRNLHALNLLDMILNDHFEEPYDKFPPEGPLPYLSLAVVKSKLSPKILNYAKFLIIDIPRIKDESAYGIVFVHIAHGLVHLKEGILLKVSISIPVNGGIERFHADIEHLPYLLAQSHL